MKIRIAPWVLMVCIGLSLDAGACGGSGAAGSAGKLEAGSTDGELDAAAPSDASGALDTATSDTGPGSGQDDAGSCGLPRTTLGQGCDACMQTNCEPAWCACAEQSLTSAEAGSGDADARSNDADTANAEAGTDAARNTDADAAGAEAGNDAGRSAGSADAAGSHDDDAAGGAPLDGESADAESADAVGNVDVGATVPGCLGYAKCVEGCVAADAGSPTECFQTECALAAYTSTQQQAGRAFLDCLVQYCARDCGE